MTIMQWKDDASEGEVKAVNVLIGCQLVLSQSLLAVIVQPAEGSLYLPNSVEWEDPGVFLGD